MTDNRYPSRNEVVNDLCKFMWDRLPTCICKPIQAVNDKPSLCEDWWVDEKIKAGYSIPGVNNTEDGLRKIYRWGRHIAIEKGDWFNIDYHKELLLHQITELMPILFMKAGKV